MTARTASRARAAAAPEPEEPAGQRGKLTDQAYEQIEEAIVTLRLAPGSSVSELQLSEMTGIGRTPIREAIQRLAREHLIMVLPQRGQARHGGTARAFQAAGHRVPAIVTQRR